MAAYAEHSPLLQPAELGLGHLFDYIHEAVIAIDVASGRIALWNPAAESLFGYSASEAATLSLEVLIPEHLRPAHRSGLARYRETGHGRLIDSRKPIEVPAVGKSGRGLWVELSLNRVEHVHSRDRYVLAIIRDVTDRKQLEAQRENKARLDGVFLAARTAEHELNNQLAAASGHLQLALRDSTLPSHLRKRLSSAVQHLENTAAIIRRIKHLTTIEETSWGGVGTSTIDLVKPGDERSPS